MTSEKFSLSKRKPFRNLLIAIFPSLFFISAIAFTIASEPISDTESKLKIGLFLVLLISSIIVIPLILLWIFYGVYKSEGFYFDGSKINYEFTYIIKKRVSLPLEKINIVKIKRNIADLLIGTSTVEIGSGSMSTSVKSEIKLCLSKQYAVYFTDYLQRYSKAVKENNDFTEVLQNADIINNEFVEASEAAMDIKMSVADKFKYIFSGKLLASALACLIVLPLLFLCINIFSPESITDSLTSENISNLESFLLGLFIAGSITISLVIGASIRAFVNFFDYRITKTADGIKINYGLFNKKSFFVSFDKVHGYAIESNLIQQIFKLGTLQLCVIGMSDATGENNSFSTTYLYPCGNIKKLEAIIAGIMPNYRFEGALNKATKKSIIHTVFIPITTTLLIMLPIFLYLAININVYIMIAPYALMIILMGLNGLLVNKNAGFGIEENFICVQNGGFIKKYSIIKTTSVQEISTYAGFIRRKHRLCSYRIIYRGSSFFNSRLTVRNIPEITLEKLN